MGAPNLAPRYVYESKEKVKSVEREVLKVSTPFKPF